MNERNDNFLGMLEPDFVPCKPDDTGKMGEYPVSNMKLLFAAVIENAKDDIECGIRMENALKKSGKNEAEMSKSERLRTSVIRRNAKDARDFFVTRRLDFFLRPIDIDPGYFRKHIVEKYGLPTEERIADGKTI